MLDRPRSPGAAVAVLQGGEILCHRAHGLADLDAGLAFTTQTPFAIASMTKQFTTTCILLLEQEGRLSLTDDYRTYLPDMPDYGATITIDHLCRNTSGIRDIFALTTLSGGHWLEPRPRSFLQETLALQRSLNFPTGSQYRYSNPNFAMLSWIIERITGQRLGEFMAERIFQPLGMDDTALHDLRGPARTGGARCYDGADADHLRPSQWEAFSRSGSGEGGGAIWSTLDDLVRWERNFDHPVVGSAELFRRLAEPPVIPGAGASSYARGLFVGEHRGLRFEGHSGGFGPCACNRVRFPERQLSVIILSNSALVDPYLGVFEVADSVLDMDATLPPAPAFSMAKAEDLQPWLGAYEDPGSGLYFVLGERDAAAQLVAFGVPMPLEQTAPDEFLAARGGSLPMSVSLGPARPVPEICVQLGPNPPMRMQRAPADTGGDDPVEGEYYSDDLRATHEVARFDGEPRVSIRGPRGRLENLPLERIGRDSYVARCGDGPRALYRFGQSSKAPPGDAVVSIARAEGVRLRRVGPG